MEQTTIGNKSCNGPNLKSNDARCPDESRHIRSADVRHNPFIQSLQPLVARKAIAAPSAESEDITPVMLDHSMRLQVSSTFN